MSMLVPRISAYQQLQNWRIGQANINNQQLGIGSTDFSSSFANAANNLYTGEVVLGAAAMGTRVSQQNQSAATPGSRSTATDPVLLTTQAAGKLILSNLLGTGGIQSKSSSGQSTSGTYQAPTNPGTGYSYVPTSAANVASLGAIDLLA
jgi:hypothetical protein